jgi:uncharacterized protein YutE (UPF0331/DUF86 family)
MSPKSRSIILAKLARLDEYLEYLHELQDSTERQFIADHRIHGLAERYLQLSIEILIDVARQMIIHLNLERPENNYETFELLRKHKVISAALFERVRLMAGFRNILVHDYMKIDRKIVYRTLKNNIKDFSLFKQAVIRKLGKQ